MEKYLYYWNQWQKELSSLTHIYYKQSRGSIFLRIKKVLLDIGHILAFMYSWEWQNQSLG